MGSDESGVKGQNPLPRPAAHAALDAAPHNVDGTHGNQAAMGQGGGMLPPIAVPSLAERSDDESQTRRDPLPFQCGASASIS